MASVDPAAADPLPAVATIVVRPKAVVPPVEAADATVAGVAARARFVAVCGSAALRFTRYFRTRVLPNVPAFATSALVHAGLLAMLGMWTLSDHVFDTPPQLLVEVERIRPRIAPALLDQDAEGNGGRGQESSQGGGGQPLAVHVPPRKLPDVDADRVALWFDTPVASALGSMMTLPDVNLNLALSEPKHMVDRPQPKPAPAKPVLAGPVGLRPGLGMFGGRHPAAKPVLIKKLGGTDDSEAAVKRALAWIKLHQESDGHWSLHAFPQHAKCDKKCTHPGVLSDTAGTAMGLLPFLGAGYTHTEGEHAECIRKGLTWLVSHQREDGGWTDNLMTKIYAHGQATIVLAEAYAMTKDPQLRQPLERAVGLIAAWQDQEEGGFRYVADTPGDVSITGWQVMAVHSAIAGGIQVPPQIIALATMFLDAHMLSKDQGLFRYMVNKTDITETMSAEGLLSREYCGWTYQEPALRFGVNYLLNNSLPKREKQSMYYWYYATQVFHHVGGPEWQRWNSKMRDLLIDLQIKEGHMSGSWTPKESHDLAGGRLYMTSLAAVTLEIYYRHMPLYYDGMNPEKQGLVVAP